MNIHKNARLTPKGREVMVRDVTERGMTQAEAARRHHTTPKTVAKWVRRFRAHGLEGLQDRSSRPRLLPSQTPPATRDAVEVLRRDRHTQDHIASALGLSRSTVSRILKARGLSLLSALEAKEPRPRYERETPGEIIHIDIKKLGRFYRKGHRITGDRAERAKHRKKGAKAPGWEYVHVAVDDHSRVAFSEIYPDEKKTSAVAHLKAAVEYYRRLGVTVTRVMTDNGGCYKSHAFRDACAALNIKHIRTKPYTPQTNGKAERFIKTAIHEWAYASAFETSDERKAELPNWMHRYNWHRPHMGINKATPISRLGLTRNNLLKLHT